MSTSNADEDSSAAEGPGPDDVPVEQTSDDYMYRLGTLAHDTIRAAAGVAWGRWRMTPSGP